MRHMVGRSWVDDGPAHQDTGSTVHWPVGVGHDGMTRIHPGQGRTTNPGMSDVEMDGTRRGWVTHWEVRPELPVGQVHT